MCLWGAPSPYIKEWRRGRAGPLYGAPQGSPTSTGSRIPPFLVELGALPSSRSRRDGKGREKEKEGRGRPPSLVQFGPDQGEGCGHLEALFLLSRMAQ